MLSGAHPTFLIHLRKVSTTSAAMDVSPHGKLPISCAERVP